MLRSMTGYGRAQKVLSGRDILVEIRSVNHRYYEYSSRIPRAYAYIDDKLKNLLKTGISRGKVEVSVTINNIESRDTQIAINKAVAEGYVNALRALNEELGTDGKPWLEDDLKLSKLIKLPDVFSIQKTPDNEEAIWADVSVVAAEALEKFVAMREAEGERLKADVLEKSDIILGMVAQVEKLSPMTVENYRNRLYQKLSEVLRLRSHISQLRSMLSSEETIGRKLDFIVQEMNREINTIGSKAQDLNITRIVVDAKAEIEKIREQIQNIE